MDITNILIKIGANLPGFDHGVITGAGIVIVILIIVFIFSAIFSKKKKGKIVDDDMMKNQQELISSQEVELACLKKENDIKLNAKLNEGAVFSIVLLQREGRLVDFLKENIDVYDDSQVGAAVRQIHAGCAKVMNDTFNVKPIFKTAEGDTVILDDEFDPSEVRLTGNVPEAAPYKGVLRHKGWAVADVKLPSRTGKFNAKVICPADIEF